MVDVDIDTLPHVNASVFYVPPVIVGSTPPVAVSSLPDFSITDVGPVGPVTLAGIPSSFSVGVSSLPDVNLRIREIPSLRVHIPANFRLGFSVLGVELAALNLCGEAQVITEPYVANPCEQCGPRTATNPNIQGGQVVGAVLRVGNK